VWQVLYLANDFNALSMTHDIIQCILGNVYCQWLIGWLFINVAIVALFISSACVLSSLYTIPFCPSHCWVPNSHICDSSYSDDSVSDSWHSDVVVVLPLLLWCPIRWYISFHCGCICFGCGLVITAYRRMAVNAVYLLWWWLLTLWLAKSQYHGWPLKWLSIFS
jgi:hypothetical protein